MDTAPSQNLPERDRSAGSSPEPGGWSRSARLCAVGAALLVAFWAALTFVVQPFGVPSSSMAPTLRPGDRVLVDKLAYRFGNFPRRGDVVVFEGKGSFSAEGASSPEEHFVKRVVGVGGDRVRCCDARGRLEVNGAPLSEPYLYPGDVPSAVSFDIRVPQGRLWVMGDHRSRSRDSRDHLGEPGGGTVPLDHVVGRAERVVWPPARWGRVAQDGR